MVRLECPRCKALFESQRLFTGCPRCREQHVAVNLGVKAVGDDFGALLAVLRESYGLDLHG